MQAARSSRAKKPGIVEVDTGGQWRVGLDFGDAEGAYLHVVALGKDGCGTFGADQQLTRRLCQKSEARWGQLWILGYYESGTLPAPQAHCQPARGR